MLFLAALYQRGFTLNMSQTFSRFTAFLGALAHADNPIIKKNVMKIIKEIIGNSAIGNSPYILKAFVLSIFTTIFFTLCIMLSILIILGSSTAIQFAY